MNSIPLSPLAALKLVEVHQLAHGINQFQQDPVFQEWKNFLSCGQILEQKVNVILEATSIKVFLEKIQDLLDFIDGILVFTPRNFPECAAPVSEKLDSLKNILIQIQDQAEIK